MRDQPLQPPEFPATCEGCGAEVTVEWPGKAVVACTECPERYRFDGRSIIDTRYYGGETAMSLHEWLADTVSWAVGRIGPEGEKYGEAAEREAADELDARLVESVVLPRIHAWLIERPHGDREELVAQVRAVAAEVQDAICRAYVSARIDALRRLGKTCQAVAAGREAV